MLADGVMDARGRVYEDGPHRSGPHADPILLQMKNSFHVLSKRKTYADALCSMGWVAVPLLLWQGERIRAGILL